MPRRRGRVGASALLGCLAIAAGVIAWFAWLPNHRSALLLGERYGVDVSHHQGSIDWQRVADDGITFTYIKASEGADFVDPRFDADWWGAGVAGLDRGAYQFFSLCSPGAEQARNFLQVVPDRLELPPAVDLEFSASCDERPNAHVVRRELEAFLEPIEQDLGTVAILYVGDEFAEAYPIVTSIHRPRWRLRFLLRPTTNNWMIWQVGSLAHIEGIEGPLGLDVMQAP
jgi:lysozyme